MNLRPQIFRPRIFRTLLNSSPLVRTAGGEVYDYYVDSVAGSDFSDGLTPATAFATIDKALTMDRSKSFGLARGRRYLPASAQSFGVIGHWGAYGSGHMPFIDCSLPVDIGIIQPHPTHANTYQVEVTHAVAPTFFGASKASNGPHFGLWWESAATGIVGEYLLPIYGSADTATAEAFVASNPGRMFVQKVGSTLTDARDEANGSITFRYTFRLANSGDPRIGGMIRYACYPTTNIIFRPPATVHGIACGRNTGKDLGSALTAVVDNSIPLVTYRHCVWLDPGCHANVGTQNWYFCYALSRTLSRVNGAGGYHCFTGLSETRIPVIEDSYISGFFHNIYSHGSGQNPVLQSMYGRCLWLDNCQNAFTFPSTAVPPDFEWVKITRCNSIMTQRGVLKKFTAEMAPIVGPSRNNVFGSFNTLCGTVEDGVIKFPQQTANWITDFNSTQAQAEALGTPTLRRITFPVPPQGAATSENTQGFINYVFEDVVGIRTISTTDQNSTRLLFDATMTNSYIGPTSTGGVPLFPNLAAYQAKVAGVGNDVVMFNQTQLPQFAGDPLVNPTLIGPSSILGRDMGVDPAIILALPAKLANIPTLQSTGFAP